MSLFERFTKKTIGLTFVLNKWSFVLNTTCLLLVLGCRGLEARETSQRKRLAALALSD